MYNWDARDYAQHSRGQEALARELLDQIRLQPDETVLDIGCGDGRITALIAERVPEGRIVGVDLSPDMVAFASDRFHSRAPKLTFQPADAGALPFSNEFSVVFSTAALHWVKDHGPVIAGIARALRPRGRFLLQMGGAGNVAQMIAAFERVMRKSAWSAAFEHFESSYGFHSAENYRRWLSDANLVVHEAVLLERWMEYAGREALIGWLRTAWHPYTSPVENEHSRAIFIEEVADEYLSVHPADTRGITKVRTVRLQVSGEKPSP